MRRISVLAVMVLPLVVAAFGFLPAAAESGPPGRVEVAPEDMSLAISNGTTLALALVVNGVVAGVFPGGAGRDAIPASELPALPWSVEARSPSGRVLTSMTVRAGDVWSAAIGNGGTERKGAGTRVDLSCGRLDIWSGPPCSDRRLALTHPATAIPDPPSERGPTAASRGANGPTPPLTG